MIENYNDFNAGVVFAAARLVEIHDQPTIAAEIIRCAGIKREEFKACAEHDLAFLRKNDESIPKGV